MNDARGKAAWPTVRCGLTPWGDAQRMRLAYLHVKQRGWAVRQTFLSGLAAIAVLALVPAAGAEVRCISTERTNFRVDFKLDKPQFAPRWTFAAFPEVMLGYMIGFSTAEGPYAGFSTAAVGTELLGPDNKSARIGAMQLRLSVDGEEMGIAKVWSDTGLHGFTTPEATPLLQKLAPGAPGILKLSFSAREFGELLVYSMPLAEIAAGIQSCAPKPG